MYFWDTVSVKEIDVTCHEEHDCIMLKCHILFVGNSIQSLLAKIWVMNSWTSVGFVFLFFPLSPFLRILLWIYILLLNIKVSRLFSQAPFCIILLWCFYPFIKIPNILNKKSVTGQSKKDSCGIIEKCEANYSLVSVNTVGTVQQPFH